MIRFLQSDNRITKALFVVVIGAASVAMVVYLIPGLTGAGAAAPDTYAVVYPHWYSRLLSSGDTISQNRVQQVAQSQLEQRGPQYASNPMIVQFFEQQVGQQLVQQAVLLQEAHKLGIYATNDDVLQYLRTGRHPAKAVALRDQIAFACHFSPTPAQLQLAAGSPGVQLWKMTAVAPGLLMPPAAHIIRLAIDAGQAQRRATPYKLQRFS